MRVIGMLLLVAGIVIPLSAPLMGQQGDRSVPLGSFKEIKVYDGISLRLIPSDRNEIVLKGEDTDKVAVVNNSGILKIRMQISKKIFAESSVKDRAMKSIRYIRM